MDTLSEIQLIESLMKLTQFGTRGRFLPRLEKIAKKRLLKLYESWRSLQKDKKKEHPKVIKGRSDFLSSLDTHI